MMLAAAAVLAIAACGAPAEKADEATATQAAAAAEKAKASAPAAQPTAEQPVFLGDPCSAELYQDLIGRSEAYAREANLPEGARVICHECQVTMDHAPSRLNVKIGADGAVAELTCG